MYAEAESRGRVAVAPRQRSRAPVQGEEALKAIKKANKGARGMPVALGGEEGRDKLRKAAVRGKCPVTRGCPNGETRRERSRHRGQAAGRTRGTETS